MSRKIAHLSDMHFGRVDHSVLDPLAETVTRIEPDVVVVSGDLTQRARPSEFAAARAFLDRLPRPQIVVPGNHDVPLYNLYGRFVERFDRFQQFITTDLEPEFVDGEIAVVGTNTARSLVWKGGRVNYHQITRIKERLGELDHRVTRVVVSHHPFDLPEGFSESHLVGNARMAMGHLAECGADLLLAGHMHLSSISRTVMRYQIGGHSALVVQAGTAASTRGRGELNSFNFLRIEHGRVEIELWRWSPERGAFVASPAETYRKADDGWEPA